MSELLDRARASLEGVTEGPWDHRTAPSNDGDESHAEWLAGTLLGDGEALHVLIAESPDPKFAYIVPVVTGDGPTSARNAEFIAAARQLVPELIDRLERVEALLQKWDDTEHLVARAFASEVRDALQVEENKK